MKLINRMVLTSAAVLLSSNIAFAESSITYYGNSNGFDKKIAAAALKKAAEKIGDLRGSIEGLDENFIATNKELTNSRQTALGFPRLQETTMAKPQEETIPMV